MFNVAIVSNTDVDAPSTMMNLKSSPVKSLHNMSYLSYVVLYIKYVVKHKSAKLLITYAVGKLEAALNISHLIVNIKYKQSES